MYIFNKLMNISSLKIGLGDYLGTYNITSLSPLKCFPLLCSFSFDSADPILFVAAIGAIFSATDSVCTLQVWSKILLKVSSRKLITAHGRNLVLIWNLDLYRCLIRTRHHCCTVSCSGKESLMMPLQWCSSMLFRALICPISTRRQLFSSLAISCTCSSRAPCLEFWWLTTLSWVEVLFLDWIIVLQTFYVL